MSIQPNPDDVREFFEKTIPDQIHLTAIDPEKRTGVIANDFGTDAAAAIAWALQRNAEGRNIYYTVNRVCSGLNRKPSKADIVSVRFAHVDVDPPKGAASFTNEEKDAAEERLSNAGASTIIGTGNGIQGLWRLEGDVIADQVEQINIGLIGALAGDKGTQNVDRLLRVPGLVNWPDERKRSLGRKPVLACIRLTDNGIVVSSERLLGEFPAPPNPPEAPRRGIADLGDVEPLTADSLGLAPDDYLRSLIEHPKGVDRSADTFGFTCEALRQGLSAEQIIGVLLNPENAISEHCLVQDDPMRAAKRAVESATAEDDVARRQRQRDDDKRIAAGKDETEGFPTAPIMSLDEMINLFVYIADGSQVAHLDRPRCVMSYSDFKNFTAASVGKFQDPKQPGKFVFKKVSEVWLAHPDRMTVDTITFRAGADQITLDPHGRRALNMWTPPEHPMPTSDWEERAGPFIRHIGWLFGVDADAFLDWLAHAMQRPGELPTYGWLHISRQQGTGRNWLAGVLGRIFNGATALGFDLGLTLNSGFNGELSGKLLAIVDEISEGGGGKTYQHAQSLKKIVTEETRLINPKYGRQRVEFNNCRWLIFSNSSTALPLEDEDRRFWVVRCDDAPKDPAYYENLYARREDPAFIACVAHLLRVRDISSFKPGQRPPMTEAKKALLERMRSEAEQTLHEIADRWPVDIVTSAELDEQLGFDRPQRAAWKHALERAGMVKVREHKVRAHGIRKRLIYYTLRNHDVWKDASIEGVRAEVVRVSEFLKYAALTDDDLPSSADDDGRDLV